MHVHVQGPDGEAKYWMEPTIELAVNYGLTSRQLTKVAALVEEHADEIRQAWQEHFGN